VKERGGERRMEGVGMRKRSVHTNNDFYNYSHEQIYKPYSFNHILPLIFTD